MTTIQSENHINQEELNLIKTHLQKSLSESMPKEKVQSILTKLDILYKIQEYIQKKNGHDTNETVFQITEEELLDIICHELEKVNQKFEQINENFKDKVNHLEEMEVKRG